MCIPLSHILRGCMEISQLSLFKDADTRNTGTLILLYIVCIGYDICNVGEWPLSIGWYDGNFKPRKLVLWKNWSAQVFFPTKHIANEQNLGLGPSRGLFWGEHPSPKHQKKNQHTSQQFTTSTWKFEATFSADFGPPLTSVRKAQRSRLRFFVGDDLSF